MSTSPTAYCQCISSLADAIDSIRLAIKGETTLIGVAKRRSWRGHQCSIDISDIKVWELDIDLVQDIRKQLGTIIQATLDIEAQCPGLQHRFRRLRPVRIPGISFVGQHGVSYHQAMLRTSHRIWTCLDAMTSSVRSKAVVVGLLRDCLNNYDVERVKELLQTESDGATETTNENGSPPMAKGKDINGMMLDALRVNPNLASNSATQWATYLKCSTSTVKESPTWKNIMRQRSENKRRQSKD